MQAYARITKEHVQFFAFGFPDNHILISLNAVYAPKGSIIVEKWFSEIHNLYNKGRLNYMYESFRQNVHLHPNIFSHYPTMWTYFYVNVAFQVAIQRRVPRNCALQVYPSSEGQYALLTTVNWDPEQYAAVFRKELKNHRYPISKLAGIHRQYLWPDVSQPPPYPNPEFYPLKIGITISKNVKRKAMSHSLLSLLHLYIILYRVLNPTHPLTYS